MPTLELLEDRTVPSGATIQGQVWHDMNGNGVRESSEPFLNGWTIELRDASGVVASQATQSQDIDGSAGNEDGAYRFTDLPPGPYVVHEVAPFGWEQTSPTFTTAFTTNGTTAGDWDYSDVDGNGIPGPANWPAIAPDTAGSFQSPIDLSGPTVALWRWLDTEYAPTVPAKILNNGHTIAVEYPSSGQNAVTINGQEFKLEQIQFHAGSEHTDNGVRASMELQLVHRHANGGLTVLALLLDATATTDNQTLKPLFDRFVNVPDKDNQVATGLKAFDAGKLLPTDMQGWFYEGSLTAPPGNEGVNWFVFKTHLKISPAQLAKYVNAANRAGETGAGGADAAHDFHPGFRPVQLLNGRVLNELNHEVTLQANATVTADFGVNSALIPLATERHFFVDSTGLKEDVVRGVKWLRGDVNQFGNSWYYILPNGDFYEWDGRSLNGKRLLGDVNLLDKPWLFGDRHGGFSVWDSRGLKGNLLARAGKLAWENPELIVNALTVFVANPAEVQAADQARAFYRSSEDNFRFNEQGAQEKWIKGRIAAKAPANRDNPWYYILPNGSVFEWDGKPGLHGTQVAAITPDVNLWRDPSLLTEAFVDLSVNSDGLDQARHFFIDRSEGLVRNFRENRLGLDEKWIRGDFHQFHNNLYYILPNGDLYEWSGSPDGAGSHLLANLGANAWNNLERVVQDFQPTLAAEEIEQLATLDMRYRLFRASNESGPGFSHIYPDRKWLVGKTNSFGNPWYFITPDNRLIEWNGRGSGGRVLARNLPPEVYADPLLLANAYADGSVLD